MGDLFRMTRNLQKAAMFPSLQSTLLSHAMSMAKTRLMGWTCSCFLFQSFQDSETEFCKMYLLFFFGKWRKDQKASPPAYLPIMQTT